jgi:TatA/E family protein of Tat protein translocase
MFGMGMPEILLILAIALIVIGPQKLPELAKSLGRAMNEFKRATNELKDSMDLDGDLKDVKQSFNDIQSNLKKKPIDLVADGLSSKSKEGDGGGKNRAPEPSPGTESASGAAADSGDADDEEGPATDIPAELMSEEEPAFPARPVRPPASGAGRPEAVEAESPRDSDSDTSPRNG